MFLRISPNRKQKTGIFPRFFIHQEDKIIAGEIKKKKKGLFKVYQRIAVSNL